MQREAEESRVDPALVKIVLTPAQDNKDVMLDRASTPANLQVAVKRYRDKILIKERKQEITNTCRIVFKLNAILLTEMRSCSEGG